MKKIIYISLLVIEILSKINVVEYGKEIPFDINNNEFLLTFKEPGLLLISITFGTPDILNLNMFYTSLDDEILIDPPGDKILMPYRPNYTNKIILEYLSPSNTKGTIMFLPTTEEMPIKLNQIYQWKYNIICHFYNLDKNELIYSIDKAEKDAILEFKYDNNFKVEENVIAQNPSKICHGDTCENSITTYNIKKGESYKIYITLNVIEKPKENKPSINTYYLPSFSFHFIYGEEKKTEEEIIQVEEIKPEEEIKPKGIEEEPKQKQEGEKENSAQSQKKENSFISSRNLNIFLIISNVVTIIILGITCVSLLRKQGN